MAKHSYPLHGWLPEGTPFRWDHSDHGEDLVIGGKKIIQAPGDWTCLAVRSDASFPNGFGPNYPNVRITSGPWKDFGAYLGHTTSLVREGERGRFGHPLAIADQSEHHVGWPAGWVELGEAAFGPSGFGPTYHGPPHAYRAQLLSDLVIDVPDPPLKFGDKSWRVIGLTSNLHACGWFKPAYRALFDREVHGAVVAFKAFHKIAMPPVLKSPAVQQDRGIVDAATDAAIKKAADHCKATKTKEHTG